ncbi:hypothetical protein Ndes2526A_g06544 [Nannochloris sp. 'desiccata']|nr:hypothetical protein KSW81_008344 [Chlorella desiccata (nom. nud.)]
MADDLDAFYAEIATVEAEVAKTAEEDGTDGDGVAAPAQDKEEPTTEQQHEQLPSSKLGMLPPPPAPPPSAGAPGALPPPPRPPPISRPAAVISSKPVIAAPPQPATLEDEAEESKHTRPAAALPAPPPPPSRPPPPTAPPGKKVGLVRTAAGERWIDPTLSEWPENDFRIFVGNLAPEVTDAMLIQAFSQYESFSKARVVRNPKTKQSRGFGFVSFADSKHGAQALKEMHNQYIASRPCQLKRSKDDRTVTDKKGRTVKRTVNVKNQPPPEAKRHQMNQQQGQQGYGHGHQQGYGQQDYYGGANGGGGGYYQ